MLNQLKLHFNTHTEYKCIHKKFGTLLYKKGGDLLTSLSWALGSTSPNDTEYIPNVPNHNTLGEDTILAKAGYHINNLVHAEIRKFSKTKPTNKFVFVEEIKKINQSLWIFLETITSTSRAKQHTGETIRSKHLRRYYLYCQLLFCTNTQQPLPLHLLLADTIEVCGGSRKLMKIFNQLGAVCSPDTHDRFVTEIANTQRHKSIWDDLPNNTLTIASVENFDMLQSFAAVYCGDQHRSYHGTTVQLTQPNPAIHLKEIPCANKVAKRILELSPGTSPHKLGKIGPKRPRTLTPRNLAKQIKMATPISLQDHSQPSQTTKSIADFKENEYETRERKRLERKMLAYNFLKHQFPKKEEVLHEFKDLYAYSTQDAIEKSNIYYMEMVDENPDSSDTMRFVAELLLSTTASNNQEGYIILVGDGKTYQHLIEIKHTYGASLHKSYLSRRMAPH